MSRPEPSRMKSHRTPDERGFSLIELLVAAGLAATVLTVGVLIFQNIGAGRYHVSSYGAVTIGAAAIENFYGQVGTDVLTYWAPNYGRAAQAEILRERFLDDIAHANAVFCLGRNGLNTTRPTVIPPEGAATGSFHGRSIDSPDAFLAHLSFFFPDAATTFAPYRGASTATNASIFILQPSSAADSLSVRAIYEIDLTPTTPGSSPEGTYASVRRYVGDTLTDRFDVFFPSGPGALDFNPLVVAFERSARLATPDSSDPFKKAADRPFYFVWWPDPAERRLEAAAAPAFGTDDPRAAYAAMGGRTPYFFAVPMFPSL
jgi:type II secretory pathway pseudopilin PulG